MSQQNAQALQNQIEVSQQIKQEELSEENRRSRIERGARRCGICGVIGHNARTCKANIKTDEESDSN